MQVYYIYLSFNRILRNFKDFTTISISAKAFFSVKSAFDIHNLLDFGFHMNINLFYGLEGLCRYTMFDMGTHNVPEIINFDLTYLTRYFIMINF